MVPMAGIVALVERDNTLLGELDHDSHSRLSLRQSKQEEDPKKLDTTEDDATHPKDDATHPKDNPAESGKKGNPPLVAQGTNVGTLAVNNATSTEPEDNVMDTFSQSEQGRGEEEKDTDPMDNLDVSGRSGNPMLGTHRTSAGTPVWNRASTPMLDDSHTDTSPQPGWEESEEMEDLPEDITDVSGRSGTNPWESHGTMHNSPDENLHPTTQVEDDPMDTSNFHERNNQVRENYYNLQLGQNIANASVPENSNNHRFGQHDLNDPEPEYYNEFLESGHENSNNHPFGQHDLNEFLEHLYENNSHQFGQHDLNDPEPDHHNEFVEPVYENNNHYFAQLDTNAPELEFYNEFLMGNHVIEPMPEYAFI